MKRFELINNLIKKFQYESYLEIGVADGSCFSQVSCKEKTSVDPALEPKYQSARPTFKMTSDDFFQTNEKKFDIIFIDGLHHSDQVDKDIENSLKCLNENGIILLHDCNAITEISQRVPRETSYWVGDVWKSIVRYRNKTSKQEFGCVTLHLLPNEEDMSIIKRTITHSFDVEMPDTLTYEWLENNRDNGLGLIVNVQEFINNLT